MRALLLVSVLLCAPGCLVLSVNPVFDRESVEFDPAFVGTWLNTEDNASLVIERGEWQSYRVHYVYPIETGDLTAYLTTVGKARYMDLMPARGEDRGSFLVPVHALVRVELTEDELKVGALSYDWFFDRIGRGRPVPGLHVVLDQKENALIVSPGARVREWLRRQPLSGEMFGAPAVFRRTR